jgi:hypothetical protein
LPRKELKQQCNDKRCKQNEINEWRPGVAPTISNTKMQTQMQGWNQECLHEYWWNSCGWNKKAKIFQNWHSFLLRIVVFIMNVELLFYQTDITQ